MQAETLKGVALVLFAVCVWSGWVITSRFAVNTTLSAYDIAAIRFFGGGMLLLPVVLKRGWGVGPHGMISSFLLSVFMGAPYTLLAIQGMRYAPASHASTILNGVLLSVTTLVGVHGLREHISRLRLFGVLVSLGGIGIMMIARSAASTPDQWLGHLLFMAAGLIWAIYTLLVRAWKVDGLHAAAVVNVYAMIAYLPVYLLFFRHTGAWPWREIMFQAFYQGVLTAVLAFTAFNIAINILGAARAVAFVPLVPVLSTLMAVPFLHEIPSPLECLGVGAVSFGVFLSSGVLQWRSRR